MTAFLVVRDGAEAVTVNAVEPRDSPAHVAFRPATGTRSSWAPPGRRCSSPNRRRTTTGPSWSPPARAAGVVAGRGHPRHAGRRRPGPPSRRVGRRALAVIFVDQTVDAGVVGPVLVTAADRVSDALG